MCVLKLLSCLIYLGIIKIQLPAGVFYTTTLKNIKSRKYQYIKFVYWIKLRAFKASSSYSSF